jgi:DNA-binding NarL/FixJ family response regulator
MAKLRALIVEDEPLVAEDIAACIEALGYEAAYICYSGAEAIAQIEENKFDFALLDISLSDEIDGIGVAERFRQKQAAPFLYLTSHSDRNTLERAKSTMPSGYLLKPFDENDLSTALEIAIYNYIHQHDIADSGLFKLDVLNERLATPLSQKEFDIISQLKLGKTNKEIAEALFVSVNTVKTHLNRLYTKLDATNRTEVLFRIEALLKN